MSVQLLLGNPAVLSKKRHLKKRKPKWGGYLKAEGTGEVARDSETLFLKSVLSYTFFSFF